MRLELQAADVHVLEGSGSPSNRRAVLPAAARIARAIKRWRPDVVHLHTEVPELAYGVAAMLSTGRHPAAVVRTIHNTEYWPAWRLAGRLVRRQLRNSRTVAVSEAARFAFLAWQGALGPCDVILNGVSPFDLPRPVRPPGHVPALLFAGRLESQKGIDVLLDAVDALDPRVTPYTLTVIGSGHLEAVVRARVRTKGSPVTLRPPTSDLRRELADFDALLIPSRFEGLPLTVVEALYAGLPVLATDAPGLSEALPDTYPAPIVPGDPLALAAMIRRFVTDPSPWFAAAPGARAWALKRFDVGAMVDAYARVYHEVSGSSG
jgi:glycosyltransferase involved in cell wall biosynthesis